MTADAASLRDSLHAAVPAAMKARDRRTVSALRSALAAIANAEAVEVGGEVLAGAIEASPVGVGAAEVARRVLSEADVAAIVRAEIAERRAAADAYGGRARRAGGRTRRGGRRFGPVPEVRDRLRPPAPAWR